MAKKEQVRWNSTKSQDAENARIREIKNIVFAEMTPTVEAVNTLARGMASLMRDRDGAPQSVVSSPKSDPVNHPIHYTQGGIEVIDAIEAWELGFDDGNAVKYLARAKYKGHRLGDLKKARWYVERAIAREEKKS